LVGPMVVRVFQPLAQPKTINKCQYSVCDHLCLPSRSNQSHGFKIRNPYKCHCADGYISHDDDVSCEPIATAPASNGVPIDTVSRSSGHTAFVTIAFMGCIALIVSFVAYAVWRRVYKNAHKRSTMTNTVYRRAMTDGGHSGGQQYDHLRLPIGATNGPVLSRGSGVYQPTTMQDDSIDPDMIGVGVVQNGKYSMKLPLTENEEGPDYA